ncbi:serine/threonine-protein kinase Chk1-like [Oratosquilla oratoria]|uniref:serine/threonine-protein kinase Chk1-like n=1 Tax=Oratosquilla oratoria TaxID=337810 RepID=UPI003F75B744
MQLNSLSSHKGVLEELVADFSVGHRTSRDFAKDSELAVADTVILFNIEEELKNVETPINKRRCSESQNEVLHLNKKLRTSDDNDFRTSWNEVKFLGKGGFGSVHLVEDTSSSLLCARKSVKINHIQSQQREVDIHKKLDHENIIGFFGETVHQEYIYIYLEYASGGTMHDKIGAKEVPEDTARGYFVHLITGVRYLHSLKITHRDLKPENLLLSASDVVKIGDFGLACEFEEGKYLTFECGTMAYTAPEVFKRHYKGEQADVWSCGIILFKLLTGRNPWRRALITDLDFEVWSTSLQLKRTSQMQEENFWREISNDTFGLLEKILVPSPEDRATLTSIEQNAWIQG